MPKDNRPPIPEEIKRKVRQRCGFGCVICGLPLYEYHHIEEWSIVKEHTADNLTLLCSTHHAMVGKFLSHDRIIDENSNPINLGSGWSSGVRLFFDGMSCEVQIGNNTFISDFQRFSYVIPLVIDGWPIIMFELIDGVLLLSMRLHNKENDEVLNIVRNELSYSMTPWDIKFESNFLTIREADSNVFVRLRIDLPNGIGIESAHLFFNGIGIDIKPNKTFIQGNETKFNNNFVSGGAFGLSIGEKSPAGAFQADEVQRFSVKRIFHYNG